MSLWLRNSLMATAMTLVMLTLTSVAHARGTAVGLKSHEYETERNGVKIALWEKWNAGEEKNWKSNGKIILLVHGATWSSRCTFDPVDGYSLMDTLADQGYDVWALDLHGYGHSGKTNRDWTDSTSAADDVDAAADFIRALRWVEKVHVLGYQWGSQPAGMFAVKHPKKVAKVVLFGLRYNEVDKKPAPQDHYRTNSSGSAMLKPDDGDLDPEFVRRRAAVCMQNDPKSPNGALIDIAQPSPIDPAKLTNSTMIIMGEKDSDATTLQDRLDFFKLLASHTKVFSVIQGVGKYASFEKNRGRFETSLMSFLELP